MSPSKSLCGRCILCTIFYFMARENCFVLVCSDERDNEGLLKVSFTDKQKEREKMGECRKYWVAAENQITKIWSPLLENAT